MKKKTVWIFLFLFMISSYLFSGETKKKAKDLPEKYREFLKITKYIITEEERETFLNLSLDRDRDILMDLFWKMRDPTPDTPRNEYREEHMRRINYANKYLGRGSPREGWETDMGRIYIILGPPVSKEHFEGIKGIYPAQAWYYYGDVEKGLPSHFAIVFYRRGGFGEFKLYDPVSDGPESLLINSKFMDTTNYKELYDRIRELSPTLSLVSHSMIPGDVPMNYQPSPINNIIMANILESPKKDINTTYATNFLDYEGVVSTDYMTNYVESSSNVSIIRDPLMGFNFLHFSIAPEELSIDYYEPNDEYFCNFTLTVSLRKGEDVIFQYSKDYPFYFSPDELERVRSNGIAVEDSFPVVEGTYELNILVQNSVGKQFFTLKKNIEISGDSGNPQIIGPFLGYKLKEYQRDIHIPYKVLNRKLVIDPKNTYSSSDEISLLFVLSNIDKELWSKGKVKINVNGLKKLGPNKKSFTLNLNNYPFRRILTISHSLSAEELSPDYYEMDLSLVDKRGKIIESESSNFIVSSAEAVSHPIAHAKAFPLSSSYLYYYMLARQHKNVNHYERAAKYFEEAYGLRPDFKKGLLEYADFLINIKKYDKCIEIIDPLKDDDNLKYQYYLLTGLAQMGMENYDEAIDSLLNGNKIYNSDTRLLNSLGICFYETGRKKEALNVLKASLDLNASQEKIKGLISEIEKEKHEQ
ncbi:MAG: GWxTD domain-containing protein [Candidatus Aminicenantaceae bacterium]